WIFLPGADVLVRRVLENPGTVGGARRITVLRFPGSSGADLRIADHVDERHLADDRTEQLRALHHARAHQQPAVRAAPDAELPRRARPGAHEVLRPRLEGIERPLAFAAERRLVPAWPILPPAANVGDREYSATRQPQHAEVCRIARRLGNLEPTVTVEHRR